MLPWMDAEMADVLITLHEAWAEKLDEAVERMQTLGLDVTSVDRLQGLVEGSVEVHVLPSIQRLESVAYVRKTLEYGANFPPGDPRDRDGR
jgi:hypothetical protein